MWKGELDKIFQVRAAQKPLFCKGTHLPLQKAEQSLSTGILHFLELAPRCSCWQLFLDQVMKAASSFSDPQ